jgi:hypothetical protein
MSADRNSRPAADSDREPNTPRSSRNSPRSCGATQRSRPTATNLELRAREPQRSPSLAPTTPTARQEAPQSRPRRSTQRHSERPARRRRASRSQVTRSSGVARAASLGRPTAIANRIRRSPGRTAHVSRGATQRSPLPPPTWNSSIAAAVLAEPRANSNRAPGTRDRPAFCGATRSGRSVAVDLEFGVSRAPDRGLRRVRRQRSRTDSAAIAAVSLPVPAAPIRAVGPPPSSGKSGAAGRAKHAAIEAETEGVQVCGAAGRGSHAVELGFRCRGPGRVRRAGRERSRTVGAR